jgi:hypothetical protein
VITGLGANGAAASGELRLHNHDNADVCIGLRVFSYRKGWGWRYILCGEEEEEEGIMLGNNKKDGMQ